MPASTTVAEGASRDGGDYILDAPPDGTEIQAGFASAAVMLLG